MSAAMITCERMVAAVRIAEASAPEKWTPAHDLRLASALLQDPDGWGGAVKAVMEETGYSLSTCLTRLRKLLPPVITADAKAALLAELEARTKAEQEDAQ